MRTDVSEVLHDYPNLFRLCEKLFMVTEKSGGRVIVGSAPFCVNPDGSLWLEPPPVALFIEPRNDAFDLLDEIVLISYRIEQQYYTEWQLEYLEKRGGQLAKIIERFFSNLPPAGIPARPSALN